MAGKSTYSLYLAKDGVTEFEDLLTQGARDRIAVGSGHGVTSKDFGEGAAVFYFPGKGKTPDWVKELSAHFEFEMPIRSQTPCSVLVFRMGERLYAVTFSFGHMYLDKSKIEPDFGLRVAINSVDDGKLRGVERANLREAIRDFAQSASHKDLRSFGLDEALDLIRRVSGKTANEDFADMVTGSRALRFVKEMDVSELPGTAAEAFELFKSHEYKKTSFRIIDFLAPINDSDLQFALDELLVEKIKDGTDEFEVAIPEILPDKGVYFKFERARIKGYHPDLSLELYRNRLGVSMKALDLKMLKHHSIVAYEQGSDKPYARWSVHYSLIGSLSHEGGRFALSEGVWYRIDETYKNSADALFERLLIDVDKKLRALKKISAPKEEGGMTRYQTEESYNSEIANETKYVLLDQKIVNIEDIPGSQFEACDLMDVYGRRLIHVKKSSRQSSVLSHFFKQGHHSASLMKIYPKFAERVGQEIEKSHGKEVADKVTTSLMNEQWTVEYRIADFPRADGRFNIPFFSKLSLKEEALRMESMGFKVAVGFIPLSRIK